MRKDLTYIVTGCTGYVGNVITKKLSIFKIPNPITNTIKITPEILNCATKYCINIFLAFSFIKS